MFLINSPDGSNIYDSRGGQKIACLWGTSYSLGSDTFAAGTAGCII